MKNIFLLLAFVVIFVGCYKDESLTKFQEGEEITITGIESYYNVTFFSEVLTIDPDVTSNKKAEWEYTWGIYDNKGIGSLPPVFDTLSHVKQLNTTFERTPGQWFLVFSAKNTLTGYQVTTQTDLNIITQSTAGWIVLKDDGINADADLFPIRNSSLSDNPQMLPDSFIPIDNIVSWANNGEPMEGKGVKLGFVSNFKVLNPENNEMENTRVYVFASDNDFKIMRASDMEIVRDKSNASYGELPNLTCNFYYTNGIMSVLAGFYGKLYSITTLFPNTGRFGIYQLLDSSNPDYYLSKYLCPSQMATVLFDELTSSFVTAGYYGDIVYAQKADNGKPEGTSQIEVRNNNLTCLYMGYCVNGGFGVFADKDTGKRQILSFNVANSMNIRIQSEITESDKANNATMFTAMNDEFVMYFVGADGNIYSRLLVGTTEQLEYEVPAGETVTFIRNYRSQYSSTNVPSQVAIATSKGSGESATYHIRFFSKLGGHIDKLEMELQGNGYARDFINIFSNSATPQAINYNFRYL